MVPTLLFTRCCLIPQAEADMGTSWYFWHTQIPILMTSVSFYQAKQSPFLGDSNAHCLELIKSCTQSFMSETCLATSALWAGKDLSLWGNRYSGQYWVSRQVAQIVSLAPPPRLESSLIVLFPQTEPSVPAGYACLLHFPIRSHSHGAAPPGALETKTDGGAGVLSEISHVDHIPTCLKSHFSPFPWNLKQVALIGSFSSS